MADNAMVALNVSDTLSAESPSQYSSMVAGTRKEKADYYNATSNPKHKVGDYINQTIVVRDVFVEVIELEDEDSGDIVYAPRIVLIDMEGETYQAVSNGIFRDLARLFKTFGEPTWEDGLPCTVKQISLGKNQMLKLEVNADML